jgi:hypothetical protein
MRAFRPNEQQAQGQHLHRGVTPLEVQEATSTTAMARITAVAITRSLSILPIAVMIRTSVRERKR